MNRWEPEVGHIPREIDQVDRLIADNPSVMPRRNVEDIARTELVYLSAVGLDGETTGDEHMEVMQLT